MANISKYYTLFCRLKLLHFVRHFRIYLLCLNARILVLHSNSYLYFWTKFTFCDRGIANPATYRAQTRLAYRLTFNVKTFPPNLFRQQNQIPGLVHKRFLVQPKYNPTQTYCYLISKVRPRGWPLQKRLTQNLSRSTF